jgi:25S rRNA (adenine2142-N1)-methyltransferase
MPKTRKKKTPITTSPSSSSSSSNPHSSRTLIRQFHVLLKKQAQLQNLSKSSADQAKALAEVEHEIEELGGLSAYQRMSSIGQGADRGGQSGLSFPHFSG